MTKFIFLNSFYNDNKVLFLNFISLWIGNDKMIIWFPYINIIAYISLSLSRVSIHFELFEVYINKLHMSFVPFVQCVTIILAYVYIHYVLLGL